MKIFNTLCLEINARCNRKCEFCPVAYNVRPDERLDKNLIDKAVKELAALKYKGRVEFYIYNEPLMDLEYLETTIKQFRESTKACLMIATNGDYVRDPKTLLNLYELGVNQILVNCYSKGLYERRQSWQVFLAEHGVKIDKDVYSVKSSKSKIFWMMDKSNPDKFGQGIFRLVNRAGNIPEFIPEISQPVSRMCTKPFRLLNINWRGEALVCCQDYHGTVSFASLKTSTLVEIWNSPVMNEYRRRLLNKDRSLPLCNKCDCHAGAYPNNVDIPTGPFASKESICQLATRN